MNWLGNHIVDFIARFRSDVYLEDVDTGTIASGSNLGLDSNNKIVKATISSGSGDLTAIVAGEGLTGDDLTGPIPTLKVDASQTQITGVGTITTGQWRATVINSTYLDADTAHLSSSQTFTGAKTFTDTVALTGTGRITGIDTVSASTDAASKDYVDTKYAYTYITFSASGKPTNAGSDPEWMFPNAAKGIYEEDWTSDSNITSIILENSTALGKNHTANSIVLPHDGVLVGFHAIGRNDDNNLAFKAGLFHSSGAGTGDGIDYGDTWVNHEYTLECIASADTSGGVSGSSSYKGPCKLVSNEVNKTIVAGDVILPAIMATADNATDEIFVTWTIILKIPIV
jgi:hypothetical protein